MGPSAATPVEPSVPAAEPLRVLHSFGARFRFLQRMLSAVHDGLARYEILRYGQFVLSYLDPA